ncbi:hypothetical protein ACUSIJ_28730 [Pseudochelatococcus sp. B33]
MRILLSTYGSRRDVDQMEAQAVEFRAHGAEVRVCAPPDKEFAELLARADVTFVPFAKSWRSWAESPSTAEERAPSVGAQDGPAPGTGARATAVAGKIRTDGASVVAKLLLDTTSGERASGSA